ncbi:MAG: DDE-type integrase/transposase/recombinase [Candidatus Sericytochromatia bacterium]|nr:DDE-type integrase/transposase/recombinase [Candidatus Sericytochromatia bacterium]
MDLTPFPPAQEQALARFAVIAPLVCRQLDPLEATTVRTAIVSQAHHFPNDTLRRIDPRTLRRWVAVYRAALPNGTAAALQALYPQTRSDKGVPRVFDLKVIEAAVALRLELATRSTTDLLAHLPNGPKEATLAYHLRARGVTRKALKTQGKAFPRYEAATVNATWQSDVTEGFYVPDPTAPGKFRQVYLMGFIDDHSRLIAHGEWYFKESLPCLFDCLKKAVLRRGVPATLYWDNGPIYRAKQVELLAARLGAKIVFSTPYAPAGKGKIERFWQTSASSFLLEAAHAEIKTLPELNQAFWAWLDRYHHRKHQSTGMTPMARWESGAETVRYPNPAEIHDIFLWEETRLVQKTGTVSLAGNAYRVSDALVGRTVQVRYDPLDLATVKVYTNGAFCEIAAPYRLTAHTHRKATPLAQDEHYLPLASSKRLIQDSVTARQDTIGEAFNLVTAPDMHGDRLTIEGFRSLLAQRLARQQLDPGEQAEADTFFRRHAPLSVSALTQTLTAVLEAKGADRHLAYYLSEIRQSVIGKAGRV